MTVYQVPGTYSYVGIVVAALLVVELTLLHYYVSTILHYFVL